MDSSRHLIQTPRPPTRLVRRHRCQNLFHDVPKHPNSHPREDNRFQTPIAGFSQGHYHESPWHVLSPSKSRSAKLIPLISKFEALDATSLGFTIREAQPSPLRLSRAGGRDTADMGRVKMTREHLLNLSERPGWGARTLRGFKGSESGENFGLFDDVTLAIGGEKHGSKLSDSPKVLDQNPKSHRIRGRAGCIRDETMMRERERQESRVKDKIRFFDGSRDARFSHVREMWNQGGIDGAVASNYSSNQAPVVSTAIPGIHLASPYKHFHSRTTPLKLHGNITEKGVHLPPSKVSASREQEPVGSRRVNQTPDTSHFRERRRERLQHAAIIKTPNTTMAVVSQRSCTYGESKDKVGERVETPYASRSREWENEGKSTIGVPSEELNLRNTLLTTPLAIVESKVAGELIDEEKVTRRKDGEGMREKISPGFEVHMRATRESKIQNRIAQFSNIDGVMRSDNPSPTKFNVPHFSHRLGRGQVSAHNEAHPRAQTTKLIGDMSISHAHPQTALVQDDNSEPEPMSKRQGGPFKDTPKAHHQKQGSYTLALGRQSHTKDKIQHYETFMSIKPVRIVSLALQDSAFRPRPPMAKRVRTWPFPVNEKITHEEKGGRELIFGPVEENITQKRIDQRAILATPFRIEEGETKNSWSRERQRQKLHARQERLARRSRSRSRSAHSTAGPAAGLPLGKGTVKKKSEHERAHQDSQGRISLLLDATSYEPPQIYRRGGGDETVTEIWIDGDGDEDGLGEGLEARVMDTVVAQCELVEPRPLRLVEMVRMARLCRRVFPERERGMERGMGREKRGSRGGSEGGRKRRVTREMRDPGKESEMVMLRG